MPSDKGTQEDHERFHEVFLGAWKEVIEADRQEQVILVPMMLVMTVGTIPLFPLFWAFEELKIWSIESGWSLP